jgi:tetratricopeptide (TPR) repeat protein
LGGDPQRAGWVHLVRYHHGVALFESGKPAEARVAFDAVTTAARDQPIGAEAALRSCQCQADEARKKIDALEKERAKGGLTPEELTQLDGRLKQAKAELLGVAKLYERRAEEFKAAQPRAEARCRMLYDAAWAHKAAGGDPAPGYTKLIAEFPDLLLAVEARLDLAELLADNGKPDDAAKLLRAALDAEPIDKPTPPETTERIRLRLGAALFDRKEFAAAQGQFEAVARNQKSPHRGQAVYRSAECLMAQKKFPEAADKLKVFRDNGAFHNVSGVSDRAVLRLGHTLLELKQWEPARQAFELVTARYGGNGPWAADARYGAGRALQNLGRFDDAGRAFQAVYVTSERPDLKFAAMVEHARVLAVQKKPDDAAKLLERVLQDAPKDSEWAKAAKEQLGKLKK